MAKEAVDQPEAFDGAADEDAPIIDLESREVKNLTPEEAKAPPTVAALDAEPAPKSEAPAEANTGGNSGDEAEQGELTETLGKLLAAIEGLREGRDAISMRRDLVSLHDKLMPEIQASRDAAKQSETAIEKLAESGDDAKVMLAKIDGSISGLEGYLLVNLEERLQTVTDSIQSAQGGSRTSKWLKLAVFGNFVLTIFVLCLLIWPTESQGFLNALASFSFDDWLTSLQPRP